MIYRTQKRSTQNLLIFSAVLCLCLEILLTGCSAVSTVSDRAAKMAESLPFTGGHLKKRVAVVPLGNRTFIREDIIRAVGRRFAEVLDEECDDIVLITPENPAYPAQLSEVPRNAAGAPDNLALANAGSDAGLNAVVTVTVTDTDADEKEKGILIFRDTHYFGTVRADVAVYDTGTGAKLLDESISRKKELDGAEYDAVKARNADGIYEMKDLLETIAEEGGEIVCKSIQKQPWQGYVSAAADGKILLSCGRETGMKVGDRFEVFDRGEVIRGRYGQQFYIPGSKTGEIIITSVLVGRAEGIPAEKAGAKAKPGFFVRLK
ncbi:MAG: hypothetical protein R2941_05990 [Desulfobacterales bacterium]